MAQLKIDRGLAWLLAQPLLRAFRRQQWLVSEKPKRLVGQARDRSH
jgi:hypothetical protein